jgi:hypothetical protein
VHLIQDRRCRAHRAARSPQLHQQVDLLLVRVRAVRIAQQPLEDVFRLRGVWYFLHHGRAHVAGEMTQMPMSAARLSIVVLPFANLSGDPGQDYFAEGVTENLTTARSRLRGSFVIARSTASALKGKARKDRAIRLKSVGTVTGLST